MGLMLCIHGNDPQDEGGCPECSLVFKKKEWAKERRAFRKMIETLLVYAESELEYRAKMREPEKDLVGLELVIAEAKRLARQ